MSYICIEIMGSGERLKLDRPVWITVNRNGIHATPHRIKAMGVGDGDSIWSLGGLKDYPLARIITLAEYLQQPDEGVVDPELTAEEALNIILGGKYETE